MEIKLGKQVWGQIGEWGRLPWRPHCVCLEWESRHLVLWSLPLIPFSQEMENTIVEDTLSGLPSFGCSRREETHLFILSFSKCQAVTVIGTESKSRFVSVYTDTLPAEGKDKPIAISSFNMLSTVLHAGDTMVDRQVCSCLGKFLFWCEKTDIE